MISGRDAECRVFVEWPMQPLVVTSAGRSMPHLENCDFVRSVEDQRS